MVEYTEVKYKCEYCDFQSTDKKKVERCENSHVGINTTVKRVRYVPGKIFPTALFVEFNDGRHIGRYQLGRVEDKE